MWTSKNCGRYDEVVALSERSDGRGMGACGAAHCVGQARRQSASCRRARSRQRPDVYPEHRCQWRAIAKDLPPRSTLYDYFDLWAGTARSIASTTRFMGSAAKPPRAMQPTAAIIDSRASRARKGLRLIRRLRCSKKIKAGSATSSSTRRLADHASPLADVRPHGGALLMASLFGAFVPDQALCRRRYQDRSSRARETDLPSLEIVAIVSRFSLQR